MSFTDCKPFVIDAETFKAFHRVKKRFNCKLCGKIFAEGDGARWIYANFKDSPVHCGNFFVCASCDGSNEDVLKRAAASYEQAEKLAKQWNIYGPEW